MELRRWFCYIFINYAVLLLYTGAKPFNLNEAIAAESEGRQDLGPSTRSERPKISETGAERISLNKVLRSNPSKTRKLKPIDSITPRGNKISSLKYKKKFQIRSPLKPKKLKHILRRRYKRKNKTTKREANNNERINPKFIPLLKSIGMLFDNILTSDSDEDYEIDTDKFQRDRHYSEESDVDCSCTRNSDRKTDESKRHRKPNLYTTTDGKPAKSKTGKISIAFSDTNTKTAESKPSKETITALETLSTTISFNSEDSTEIVTTTTATYNSPVTNIRSLRHHKNISLLPTRDTNSGGRDNNAFSKRSRTTFHTGFKRNITRNNGNSQYNPRNREVETSTGSDEKDSCDVTRDGTRSVRPDKRLCGTRNFNSSTAKASDKAAEDENANGYPRRYINGLQRENNFEIKRNKTEDTTSIPELVHKSTGFLPNEISNVADSAQSIQAHKESDVRVAYINTSNKRVLDENGSSTPENKRVFQGNEARITIEDIANPILQSQSPPKNAPVVTIIDGYSVARNKYGRNRISERSIRMNFNK